MRNVVSNMVAASLIVVAGPISAQSTPPPIPQMAWMPLTYTVGQNFALTWDLWWVNPSQAPKSWQVLKNGTSVQTSTTFAVASPKVAGPWKGVTSLSSSTAGAFDLAIKACNASGCSTSASKRVTINPAAPPPPPPPPPVLGAEPTSVAGSVKAVQTRRAYVGYYPSWNDAAFSATNATSAALTDDQVLARSRFARIPATYTHVVVSFANPSFTWNGSMTSWAGSGLQFAAKPSDIKRAIDVLHARNFKVLLAVGGATYGNWTALAAEGNAGVAGPITQSLTRMVTSLGFDGLDVDYEVAGADAANVTRYRGAINAMRRAVDAAGGGRILTLAAWSTGADCTAATATLPCGNAISYWGGSAGRERILFSDAATAAKLDMVSVMSYDARYERYDGRVAWNLYRELFPAKTIVNIGLQPAPEGWAGAQLVVNDADAGCTGSVVLLDQFSATVNKPYSVQRLASVPTASTSTKTNPRDGAMLWEILKTATGNCGAAPLASPSTIAGKLNQVYGLPADPRDAWK